MSITRVEVEDFLFHEAELLDDWRLEEWYQLFDKEAQYLIPSTNLKHDANNKEQLFLVADDYLRIKGRAERLMKKGAHVEFPHAKVRHLVNNVRIKDVEQHGEDTIIYVAANFAVYRSKREMDTYTGEYHYKLIHSKDGFRILEKKALLSMYNLRPHGKISVIL